MMIIWGLLVLLAMAQARSVDDERAVRRQLPLYDPWYPYSSDFSLRLSHGSYGRLEISYGGVWHSVCDEQFDHVDATVACKQLGFLYGRKDTRGAYGLGERRALLDLLSCAGDEPRLVDCAHPGIGTFYCDGSTSAATITCSQTPLFPSPIAPAPIAPAPIAPAPVVPAPGLAHGGTYQAQFDIQSVKLTNGPHTWEGLVQVQIEGQWKYVCTNNWDDMDAKVLCRMLNSQRGIAVPAISYNTYLNFYQIQNMWMDAFSCRGTENALDQCPSMGYDRFSANCVDKSMIAAAKCDAGSLAPPASTALRLEGGSTSPYDGVVKCLHGDQYYPICADSFGAEEAQVVCNQLFPDRFNPMVGTPVFPIGGQSNAYYMTGFYDVQCQGYESSMTECFSNFISNRQQACLTGDATVVCS